MDNIGPPPDFSEFGCLEDELRARRYFMMNRGYRFCDIMACNCVSWHQGHAENRLNEISDLLMNFDAKKSGTTLRENIQAVLEEAGYTDE